MKLHYKNVIYNKCKGFVILRINKYKNRWYVIISNRGMFPCAYVSIKQDDLWNVLPSTDNFPFINDMGGVLFHNSLKNLSKIKDNYWANKEILKQSFLEWKYNKENDFVILHDLNKTLGEKSYTLTEIEQDCKDFINQLNGIIGGNKNGK